MKKLLAISAVALGVALAATAAVRAGGNDRQHWDLGDWRDWWVDIGGQYDRGNSGNNNIGDVDVTVEQDDGWDVTQPRAKARCRFNKRKCVEIASNLAYKMAESGAYVDLNDNDFSAYAIKVASHLVDNIYDHDEQEGPPTGNAQ